MKKTIYLFGNSLLDFDNLPLRLLPKLKKAFPLINFEAIDPNENLKPINKELIIIDTIERIQEVKIFSDLEKLILPPSYSLHDFDLAFNLKLLAEIGELEKVLIFGVPMNLSEEDALSQLIKLIRASLF